MKLECYILGCAWFCAVMVSIAVAATLQRDAAEQRARRLQLELDKLVQR